MGNTISYSLFSNNEQKIYFKITNEFEIHHNYRYKMDILNDNFNNNKKIKCFAGGLFYNIISNTSFL